MCIVLAPRRLENALLVVMKTWPIQILLDKTDFQKETCKNEQVRCKNGENVCTKHKIATFL